MVFVSLIHLLFQLLIQLNNLMNLFIFVVNVDIDELLLLEKNMGQEFTSFRVILFCYSCCMCPLHFGFRFLSC